MTEYRRLEHGEIVKAGDEFDAGRFPWKGIGWCPVRLDMIGEPAIDQSKSHYAVTIYRRPVEEIA